MVPGARRSAEAPNSGPAVQLVEFTRLIEEAAGQPLEAQPGCLFVSFIYERGLRDPETEQLIRDSIRH